jgi:hypothetical protein
LSNSAIASEKDLAIRKFSLRLENKRGKNTSIRKLPASTGSSLFILGERGGFPLKNKYKRIDFIGSNTSNFTKTVP